MAADTVAGNSGSAGNPDFGTAEECTPDMKTGAAGGTPGFEDGTPGFATEIGSETEIAEDLD